MDESWRNEAVVEEAASLAFECSRIEGEGPKQPGRQVARVLVSNIVFPMRRFRKDWCFLFFPILSFVGGYIFNFFFNATVRYYSIVLRVGILEYAHKKTRLLHSKQ